MVSVSRREKSYPKEVGSLSDFMKFPIPPEIKADLLKEIEEPELRRLVQVEACSAPSAILAYWGKLPEKGGIEEALRFIRLDPISSEAKKAERRLLSGERLRRILERLLQYIETRPPFPEEFAKLVKNQFPDDELIQRELERGDLLILRYKLKDLGGARGVSPFWLLLQYLDDIQTARFEAQRALSLAREEFLGYFDLQLCA